ncbi:MAG: entericidin [Muribaculaceae bacterium]|nr:entericidin [Muribaculaceae bacterium]MDY5387880.1 entericidin [Muribaculaceae bacterium]
MKKLVYSLAVLFAVSLVSCGGAKEAANDSESVAAESTVVETAAVETAAAETAAAEVAPVEAAQ